MLWIDRKCKLFLYFLKRIIPVAQIPQCNGPISHNVLFCNRYVHIPDAKWCIVGYLTNALWGWYHGSIQQVKECTKSVSSLRKCHLQNLWLFCPGCNFVLITEHINQVFNNFDKKNYWMYFSVILWHSKPAGCWNSPSRKIINMLHCYNSQYHSSSLPVNTRSQAISSHNTESCWPSFPQIACSKPWANEIVQSYLFSQT